jgi:hypothetical protein
MATIMIVLYPSLWMFIQKKLNRKYKTVKGERNVLLSYKKIDIQPNKWSGNQE